MKKIDLLTQAHKDQREWMYTLSIKAAKLDFNDINMLESFNVEFKKLINDLEEHAENEEILILPLLKEKFPHEASIFIHDHPKIEEMIHGLLKQLDELYKANPEEKQEISLNFYRSFNKFIGEYILHLNKEEEIILPTLDQHFSQENLLGVMIAFMSFRHGNDPEKVKKFISSMTESLNLTELRALFESMKTYAPGHVFQRACEFSKEVFSPDVWVQIEKNVLISQNNYQ